MIFSSKFVATSGLVLSLASIAAAHPGEGHEKRMQEAANARTVASVNARALEACNARPEVKARKQRAIARREATFDGLRQKRSLKNEPFLHRRDATDFAKWAAVDHNKTGIVDFSRDTPAEELFASNTSCVLAPDNANGPYFVYQELIREDVAEDLQGVPLHLEFQFIDVNTCEPADVLVDIWSCNSTGQYSGVSADGQGGLDSTYLRGVQPTDVEGVVNFDTIFPGHYEARASHQHIIVHVGSEILDNGTYTGGVVAHLSQLFFDQKLIDIVEALAPYNTNEIPQTPNVEDLFSGYGATAEYDPFIDYIVLGSDISSGLFAWAELGLNTSSNWDFYAPYASIWKPDGGVDNPNFNFSVVGTPPPTHG
ncbi:Intradiol ring-cleavage dioxygenase [Truncatella angustata]|uniref:Intradiol ring-cleavage dioxygenase n=1 Tax=Truncatella angustata TaxID=152316 RepID=A0A9P8UD08_9PEZI|nr:Intradiol ring-cleavage dioxygenase [Truncatella angustata]KAH6646940.1 Intradiol ring-cleavage dioxygenase [Truncatella angustata]